MTVISAMFYSCLFVCFVSCGMLSDQIHISAVMLLIMWCVEVTDNDLCSLCWPVCSMLCWILLLLLLWQSILLLLSFLQKHVKYLAIYLFSLI